VVVGAHHCCCMAVVEGSCRRLLPISHSGGGRWLSMLIGVAWQWWVFNAKLHKKYEEE